MEGDKKFDRDTALAILKDLSRNMFPSWDMFGHPTLEISRETFEDIRAKYLNKGEKENE